MLMRIGITSGKCLTLNTLLSFARITAHRSQCEFRKTRQLQRERPVHVPMPGPSLAPELLMPPPFATFVEVMSPAYTITSAGVTATVSPCHHVCRCVTNAGVSRDLFIDTIAQLFLLLEKFRLAPATYLSNRAVVFVNRNHTHSCVMGPAHPPCPSSLFSL